MIRKIKEPLKEKEIKHHDELGRETTKLQHEYKMTEEQFEIIQKSLTSRYNAEYFKDALKVIDEIKNTTKHSKG